jgi:hypothetical protein
VPARFSECLPPLTSYFSSHRNDPISCPGLVGLGAIRATAGGSCEAGGPGSVGPGGGCGVRGSPRRGRRFPGRQHHEGLLENRPGPDPSRSRRDPTHADSLSGSPLAPPFGQQLGRGRQQVRLPTRHRSRQTSHPATSSSNRQEGSRAPTTSGSPHRRGTALVGRSAGPRYSGHRATSGARGARQSRAGL